MCIFLHNVQLFKDGLSILNLIKVEVLPGKQDEGRVCAYKKVTMVLGHIDIKQSRGGGIVGWQMLL